MGVYVFKSKHGDFMKIGPPQLQNRVTVDDLELLRWYPNLKRADEKALHKRCHASSKGGEWFSMEALALVDALEASEENCAFACCIEEAKGTRRRL